MRGAPGWRAQLQRTWVRWGWSADERVLSEARDLADLEARLKRLERGREDRFAPLPPLL